MPTYEFRCPEGHEFEKFYRSIAAGPREFACPTCGKMATRQVSAGAGLVFKGSGFYITDYGKDGKKPQAPAAAESGSSPTEAATKTDAPKPDAAPSDAKAKDAKPTASKPVEKQTSDSKIKKKE